MGVFVLLLSNINMDWQKLLSALLSGWGLLLYVRCVFFRMFFLQMLQMCLLNERVALNFAVCVITWYIHGEYIVPTGK